MHDELLGEVNEAAFEGHMVLAEIFGRLVLEVDPGRYDEDEWNRLAISSFIRTLAPD